VKVGDTLFMNPNTPDLGPHSKSYGDNPAVLMAL